MNDFEKKTTNPKGVSLRLYCQGTTNNKHLPLLQNIQNRWQIPVALADLSTDGKHDPVKEQNAYEQDFKPHAKALKRATNRSITALRSHRGNYFVSSPETLAIVNNGKVIWWCHTDPELPTILRQILDTGKLPPSVTN